MQSQQHEALVSELLIRISNLIRVGKVHSADYTKALIKVEFGTATDDTPLVTGWIPFSTMRAGNNKTWEPPEVGEQVMLFSPSGDMEAAIAVPAVYQNDFPAPSDDPNVSMVKYQDGAIIKYDRAAHHLEAILPASGTTHLDSKGGVTIDGDTEINGDLTVNGNATITQNVSIGQDLTVSGSGTVANNFTIKGICAVGSLAAAASGGGAVPCTGGMNITSGDVVAEGVSLKGHTHTDSMNGQTSAPN